jgi:hypothetical protein
MMTAGKWYRTPWGLVGMACCIVFAAVFGLGLVTSVVSNLYRIGLGSLGDMMWATILGPLFNAVLDEVQPPIVTGALVFMFLAGFVLTIYGTVTGMRLRSGCWRHERPLLADYLIAAGVAAVVVHWIFLVAGATRSVG